MVPCQMESCCGSRESGSCLVQEPAGLIWIELEGSEYVSLQNRLEGSADAVRKVI